MDDNWYYNLGKTKRKDNGDISVRFSKAEIEHGKKGIFECFESLDNELEGFNISFFGEDFCINNCTMGTAAYSFYDDVVYIIPWNEFEDTLLKGKTLVLHGRKPDIGDYLDLYNDGFFTEEYDLKFLLEQLEKEEGYGEEIEQVREDLIEVEEDMANCINGK